MTTESALLPVYKRRQPHFVAGQGCWLFDDHQQGYLDFGSGIAVCCLGHCHPELVAALTEQAQRLWHCSNWFKQPVQEPPAQQLTQACFADKVFFCNSGLEANEAMVKAARSAFAGRRQKIITFAGGFHGRSLTGLAAGGHQNSPFAPLPAGFCPIPFADLDALRLELNDDACAVMLEPIQGDGGGIRVFPPTVLAEICQLCRDNQTLILYDEIQCGLGRTGDPFAYQTLARQLPDNRTDSLAPDLLSTAKGLGGGIPVGALLLSEKLTPSLPPGSHGSTFGGNPLAMAVVQRLLSIVFDRDFLDGVQAKSQKLEKILDHLVERHPQVFSQRRGMGLMQGLKLLADLNPLAFMDRLLTGKLVMIPASDNVLRLLPPLIITDQEIEQAGLILDRVAATYPSEHA